MAILGRRCYTLLKAKVADLFILKTISVLSILAKIVTANCTEDAGFHLSRRRSFKDDPEVPPDRKL
jgi:hypothetical protein